MSVLDLLHERRGEVVSTQKILDTVWAGKVVGPNSVSTVISELRKVLDEGSDTSVIETIPKRGYRLVQPAERATPQSSAPGEAHVGAGPAARQGAAFVVPVALVTLVLGALLWSAVRISDSYSGPRAVESSVTAQYLRARQLWSQRDTEGTLEARRLLENVIAIDGDFAPAHAALADIYAHKTGSYLGLTELDTFREAQRHLDHARAVDPTRPELFVTQSLLDFYRDGQPEKALASVDEALARDPQFAYAHQTRAMLLSSMGRHAESLVAIARAREIDPASTNIAWDEVWFLHLAGEQERAMTAFERESSRSSPIYLFAALIEQQRGNTAQALKFWFLRFEARDAQLSDTQAILSLAEAGAVQAAYRELLAQVRALDGYSDSGVVLATWSLLAGDPSGAATMLGSEPLSRDNWLTFWREQLPSLEPVRALSARAN